MTIVFNYPFNVSLVVCSLCVRMRFVILSIKYYYYYFKVEGNRFRANVSVSPAIDDFLLGSNWLEANGAKWDFATLEIV